MDALSDLNAHIEHLISSLLSHPVAGTESFYLTQYFLWMLVASVTVVVLMVAASRKMKLVPQGRAMNAFEMIVEFVKTDVGENVIGRDYAKHLPFLFSIFIFILVNNLYGLVPGAKNGTGTIGITGALAVISFCYFIYWGVKTHGLGGYIKSFSPAGVMFPINIIVWVIEVFSTFLRIVTLAVRLFANMFAGHIAMGALAILTSLFAAPMIEAFSAGAVVSSLPAIGWLLLLMIMYAVELIVAFIQAYVFTVLSAVYVSLATSEH